VKNHYELIILVTMLVTLFLGTAHGACDVEIDSHIDDNNFLVTFHDCPDNHEYYVVKIWRTDMPDNSRFCLVIQVTNSPGNGGAFKVPKPKESNVAQYALLDFSYKKEEAEIFCREYVDY
jgi:hypothetical protein